MSVFPLKRASQSDSSARGSMIRPASAAEKHSEAKGHDQGVRRATSDPPQTETSSAVGAYPSLTCIIDGGTNDVPAINSRKCPGPKSTLCNFLLTDTTSSAPDGVEPSHIRQTAGAAVQISEVRSLKDERSDSWTAHSSSDGSLGFFQRFFLAAAPPLPPPLPFPPLPPPLPPPLLPHHLAFGTHIFCFFPCGAWGCSRSRW